MKKTITYIIIYITAVVPPTIAAHYHGYKLGVESGITKTHMVIDESISKGTPFTFYKGDIQIVTQIRLDDKMLRKTSRQRAENHELIKYRAMQEFDEQNL